MLTALDNLLFLHLLNGDLSARLCIAQGLGVQARAPRCLLAHQFFDIITCFIQICQKSNENLFVLEG